MDTQHAEQTPPPQALVPVDEPGGLTPAGERLLTAATELFYFRGIRAVGVDLIAETAGTTKKTLYDRFGSKDALVSRYLTRRAHRWQRVLLTRLEEHDQAPGIDRVLAVFDAFERWNAALDRGCAFVNAYAEIGGTDHPGVAVVRAEKRWMRRLFDSLAREAGIEDHERVGAQLHLLYEGAVVNLTVAGQADAIDDARSAAASLLRSAA